jgi:hypothetical protein
VRGRGAKARSGRTVGEAAGQGGLRGGRQAAVGQAGSGKGGQTCPRRERTARRAGRGSAKPGTLAPGIHRRARRPPGAAGVRHRRPAPLGCPKDPGNQDRDGASPRMGRRPQLRLVKVRATRSALERGRPQLGPARDRRGMWVRWGRGAR